MFQDAILLKKLFIHHGGDEKIEIAYLFAKRIDMKFLIFNEYENFLCNIKKKLN
jgi:hypothetical protein